MDSPEVTSSFWSSKPVWCQPWSILLTGMLILIITWFTINIKIVDVVISLLVFAWWLLFLYYAPMAYEQNSTLSNLGNDD